ncbi:MAG: selenide, water dikinase SelD [Gammaproteobacteria bacterium]
MMQATPVRTDLVLVGGGHAHVEVLRRFGMRPEPGVRISVISREVLTPYSGMLPGLVAGHYTHDETHIDLAPLARFAGARLFHDEVVGLDLERRELICRERPPVSYDLLSIDTGSAPDVGATGAAAHALPVKPVSSFYARWEALRHRVVASDAPLTVGTVGGGAGGVELLMAAQHRLRADVAAAGGDPRRLAFHLVTSGPDVLPGHNARVRRRYRRALEDAGIELTTGFAVDAVEPGAVVADDGARIELDEILWVTSAAAPQWPRASGLATDAAGFIRVAPTLESVAFPGVFAAGDIAAVEAHPRPKSGVFAVRQGPPLAANLRRAARGEALVPFSPQRRFLSLISTGDRHAVASRGALALSGAWVWRWKDFIDRRFMRRYAELPQMNAGDTPSGTDDDLLETMRCGGCGSKIGAEVLRDALAELAPATRADLVVGLEAADDAAVVRVPDGHLAVHSVDAFRSFIDDPWMLGRVAAVHGLSDIYAMGATPQTALALVTLPVARTSVMKEDLVQVMRGALAVFDHADTLLVGGHTGEGSELAVGFALNGHVAPDAIVRKRGVVDGDVLILTQALGSGVLFAAAMRALARAPWIEAALDAMAMSKGAAARCLIEAGVHAMTDVTGFGLVGHLREMLDDGRHGAVVELGRLPLYPGVEQLVGDDVISSLQAENRRAAAVVTATHGPGSAARYELAFDPQTAGGLLAAVPAAASQACITALHAAGYGDSVVIGRVDASLEGIHVRD